MARARTKAKKPAAAATDVPKIITTKGGLTQGALLGEVLATMEDDLRISRKQGKDFVDSLVACVEREINAGSPVNLFGLVKVSPRFHTKGQREVFKVFGDPTSGKMTKKYPAKVSIKATVMKRVKDVLPSAAALGRKVS